MASIGLDKSLAFLERLEIEGDLEATFAVQVRTLRLKLSLLTAFVNFSGKWLFHDANLKVLLARVGAVVRDADKDLQMVWSDLVQISSYEDRRLPANMNSLVSRVLESIQLIKPDLQEVYYLISESARSTTILVTDEDVKEYIQSLLERMEDLLRFQIDSIVPVRKEMEDVEASLRFLRDFLGFTARRCSKGQQIKDLRTHAAILAHSMACLLCLCIVNSKMDDSEVHEMKLELFGQLQNVKPIQPDVRKMYIKALEHSRALDRPYVPRMDEFDLRLLVSLLGNMKELSETKLINSMIPLKNEVLALEEELRFFSHFVIDLSPKVNSELDSKIKGLFECIIPLICETGCVIYSFYNDQIYEDMVMELSTAVSDLLGKVKVAKEDTREIYLPESLRSNFPRTNEMGFICSLLKNLEEILKVKADFFAPLKHYIEQVWEGLLSLQENLCAMAKHPSKHEELEDQRTHFKDIAYLTEYVIDAFVIGDYPLWCHKLGLLDVIEETKMISTELKDIQKKLTADSFAQEISGQEADPSKIQMVVSYKDVAADEKKHTADLVVFEEEAEKIKEQLTNGLTQLHILFIVGMAGIGKTTLANSIFENPSVAYGFHVRARCCVTQVYQKRRLLAEILQQVANQTEEHMKMKDDDLEVTLYRSLKGKRYLILLDDIWDIRPWEDIQRCFPDDNKQSRIILTSRFHSIASQVESKCVTFPLYPLSDEKSWDMLQIKLFQNQNCPGELVKIGEHIAKSCKGLALAVDLVAGILRKVEQKKGCWLQVAKYLTTELIDNPQGQCRKILELSYHHLPDHLKTCFLYVGAFPEGSEIPTKRLTWLWIAEGFVQLEEADQRSLEYVAEAYLNDLIARSLISISKRRSWDGVKASRIHDLLGEFARVKAKEDRFYQQTGRYTSDGYEIYKAFRLCIYDEFWNCLWAPDPSGPRVRSILYLGKSTAVFSVGDLFKKSQLLRVLDLIGVNTRKTPDLISLVHLRFLALSTHSEDVMSKIFNLQNLETLLLKIDTSAVFFPEKLCNMKRLRHFHLLRPTIFQLLGKKMKRLDNLKTLSTPHLRYGGESEKILRQFPNLENLNCTFSLSRDYATKSYQSPKLDFLSQLKSLKATGSDVHRLPIPCKFYFPTYLKKLTLSKFHLPWSEISSIGKLEHLEVLKLRCRAFEGKIWNMKDGEFPKLKFLFLSELNIEEWNASEDHLPYLERLKVHKCRGLEELPYCLANIATLQVIELRVCNSSVEMSAKIIKEEQEQLGNDQLELLIEHRATLYSEEEIFENSAGY